MTDCNLEPIRFPSCKGRLVEASFSGGAVTSDGGAVLAGASTLCRFEQGMGREDAVRLHEALLESFIASFPCPPRRLVLDFDATDDPVHGMWEGRFFHGH